jgi:hypothetical protein
MMEKIKTHFLKFGPRRFVVGTVIVLLILDLLNSWYLRLWWVKRNLSFVFVQKLAERQGIALSDLVPNSIAEIKYLVDNCFFFFLLIVLINNLFFYFFYLRKKLWAQGYVLFYTLTNSILAFSFLIEGPILGYSWFLYNLSTIVIYLYLYFGVKVLKAETTDFIPAHGTKAQ